jgi:predicted lipoprotein
MRLVLLFGVLFFSAGPSTAFDDGALAKRALQRHILPGYQRFAGAAKDFSVRAAALCQEPSAAALEETREAARTALVAFGRIEHIRFGPISEKQRFDRLLFYPDPRGFARKQIDRLLRQQDDSALAPERLEHASVAVQGFTAIDRLLFGQGADALATPSQPSSFRCHYVRALADAIAGIAAETRDAWSDGFARTWLRPGKDNPSFLTAKETTQALFRSYVSELEVVRLQRLLPVLGDGAKSGSPAEPLLPHSRLGLPFILANIEGVRALLTECGFLDPALAATDQEQSAMAVLASVATDLLFAARAGENALDVAQNVFADPEARARLTPMILSLKNAEETGRSALGGLTGLSLGFNALDGD